MILLVIWNDGLGFWSWCFRGKLTRKSWVSGCHLGFFFLTIFLCVCDSSIWTFFVLDIAWDIIRLYVWNCPFSFRVLSDISYFTKGILKVFFLIMFVLRDSWQQEKDKNCHLSKLKWIYFCCFKYFLMVEQCDHILAPYSCL